MSLKKLWMIVVHSSGCVVISLLISEGKNVPMINEIIKRKFSALHPMIKPATAKIHAAPIATIKTRSVISMLTTRRTELNRSARTPGSTTSRGQYPKGREATRTTRLDTPRVSNGLLQVSIKHRAAKWVIATGNHTAYLS